MHSLKRDFYEQTGDINFKINQNVLFKESYFSYLTRTEGTETLHSKSTLESTSSKEWYPLANSYYPFTEDVDPLERVNHLIQSEPEFTVNQENATDQEVPYFEYQAQKRFLLQRPLCFIIFGKPDVGQKELAKIVSDYWNCVYIEPENLISDEIQRGSNIGQFLDYNLKTGKTIEIDTILKLIQNKCESEKCKHRGFVLAGLPLIANDNYTKESWTTPSAIFQAKNVLKEMFDTAYDQLDTAVPLFGRIITGEGDDDDFYDDRKQIDVQTPSTGTIIEDLGQFLNIGVEYEKQIEFIFSFLKEPLIIIYISCDTVDVISKRSATRHNIYSGMDVDSRIVSNDFHVRHLVQSPYNFSGNIECQLSNYHKAAFLHLEKYILMHNPEHYIKVDGRTNPQVMFEIVKAKLDTLPFQKPVIPVRMDFEEDDFYQGEGYDPRYKVNKKLDPEDAFKVLRTKDIVSNKFKWTLSEWRDFCPISITENRYNKGSTNFIVHFMNRIFFLRDELSLRKFITNPRSFLWKKPKPRCRIFVLGPKFCGKITLSTLLSYNFDAIVINPQRVLKFLMDKLQDEKKNVFEDQLRAEALVLLTAEKEKEAEKLEAERVVKIKEWIETTVRIIENFIETVETAKKDETVTTLEVSSFPMAMRKTSLRALQSDTKLMIRSLKEQLQAQNIPATKGFEELLPDLKLLLEDKKKLITHLPMELRKKIIPKPVTGKDDFVMNYIRQGMKKKMQSLEMELDLVMEDFLKTVRDAEEIYESKGLGSGGWIMCGILEKKKFLQKFLDTHRPDNIIMLTDSSEGNEVLKERFRKRDVITIEDYRQPFVKMEKFEVLSRIPDGEHILYIEETVENILEEILDGVIKDEDPIIEYEKTITKCNNSYKMIKSMVEKYKIAVNEVDISNKTPEELGEEVLKIIEDTYRLSARILTDADRAEEVQNLGKTEAIEGQDFTSQIDECRFYGDTSNYCPVTLHENFLLWKGKESNAVKYKEKVYLLSTSEAQKKFLYCPDMFLVDLPLKTIPPPRICITGVSSVGKFTLGSKIASNYGLAHVSFRQELRAYFHIYSEEPLIELYYQKFLEEELRNYFEGTSPLSETFYTTIMLKYWYEEPWKTTGFVISDFPKRPSDVDYMLKYKLIPDIVIELTPSLEIKTKLLKTIVDNWEQRLTLKFEERSFQIKQWEENKAKRFQELLEEKREKRYNEKLTTIIEEGETSGEETTGAHSRVSFDSVEDQKDTDEIRKILDEEFPDLFSENSLEKARFKFEQAVTEYMENDFKYLKLIQEKCNSECISYEMITEKLDFGLKSFVTALYLTDDIRYRNISMFEKCYDVSHDDAERLLECGYFFLSKFGKTCPVQYYKKENHFQMYLNNIENVFPIIHRNFVYFINGLDSVKIFKEHPLKYINQKFTFPLIPVRIAVIGPPKSGKTTLSRQIANKFGLKVLTRGQAISHVLDFLPHTNLAFKVETHLRNGLKLPCEIVIKCVEAASFDPWIATHGVVFDGFPCTITESKCMSYLCLTPYLILQFEGSEKDLEECYATCGGINNFPRYTMFYYKHLLKEWEKFNEGLTEWLHEEYQIGFTLNVASSVWKNCTESEKKINEMLSERKAYYANVYNPEVLSLKFMLVSQLEFIERKSKFLSYCPVCLNLTKSLTTGGKPPDRNNLVQYQMYFYWICDDHLSLFSQKPEKYLFTKLPENLPETVKFKSIPDNVAENGLCVVCYKLKQLTVSGLPNLATIYGGKVYLFDTKDCMSKFMKQPTDYMFSIHFKPEQNYPLLKYRELPTLGMLEQYVGHPLVYALSYVTRRRPVIPGLSITTSALIGIGLYLKINHANIPKEYKALYAEGESLYYDRRDKLIKYLAMMKSRVNPYVYYEEPLPEYEGYESNKSEGVESIVEGILDSVVQNIQS